MSILAQLSEPHITVGPRDREASAALEAAVGAVLALATPPDAVVVTGDLTDTGSDAELSRFHELMAPLAAFGVHLLAGNHDDVHSLPDATFVADAGDLRLVGVDSTVPGKPHGRLDRERLLWLEAAVTSDRPTVVAMHHPPIRTGIPAMDAIGLEPAERDALAAVLRAHPNVLRVVSGHAHRAVTGCLGGCPVFVCPSLHLQLDLVFDDRPLAVRREPPGFALHVLLDDGALVTHVVPIGDFGAAWSG